MLCYQPVPCPHMKCGSSIDHRYVTAPNAIIRHLSVAVCQCAEPIEGHPPWIKTSLFQRKQAHLSKWISVDMGCSMGRERPTKNELRSLSVTTSNLKWSTIWETCCNTAVISKKVYSYFQENQGKWVDQPPRQSPNGLTPDLNHKTLDQTKG
jgi:hypothetical protein